MEEDDLTTAIQTYKLQLSHVDQAILAAGPTPDLEALKTDLEELIKLTKDSLLSLKKSQLLKQLDVDHVADNEGVSTSGLEQGAKGGHEQELRGHQSGLSDDLDEEYAAFQAMLGDNISDKDGEKPALPRAYNSTKISKVDNSIQSSTGDNCIQLSSAENLLQSSRTDNSISSSSTKNSFPSSRADNSTTCSREESCDTNICDSQTVSDMYKEIVGTKCRAPYEHEWGRKCYGNALIAGVENDSELEIPKVRVMFCNPTHAAMLPCKYHLGGSCKFVEEQCRYSHGHVVSLEDIQEYMDPDFSLLKLESRCLARYDHDDVWYEATVVDLHDNGASVTFDDYNDEPVRLPFEDIFPVVSDGEITDQPIRSQNSEEEDDDDDDLPVFLWKPPSHGLGDLGQWEAHTKGIGSRLLTKMGYVPGQGLGKSGEGRIQPVPIQLLPQGKSLDKIMVLKELAGNRDMFDVMEKLDKKMKKEAEKLEKEYNKAKQPPNVFDFINKKLHGKKGKLSELIHKHEGHGHAGSDNGQGHRKMHRNISEQDLNSKSDRNINIQLLKTSEEIKSVHKQLVKLKESLSRNENKDKNMASQVRQKIQSLETYLDRLKSSESTMENHQQKRSDHKKLTVF